MSLRSPRMGTPFRLFNSLPTGHAEGNACGALRRAGRATRLLRLPRPPTERPPFEDSCQGWKCHPDGAHIGIRGARAPLIRVPYTPCATAWNKQCFPCDLPAHAPHRLPARRMPQPSDRLLTHRTLDVGQDRLRWKGRPQSLRTGGSLRSTPATQPRCRGFGIGFIDSVTANRAVRHAFSRESGLPLAALVPLAMQDSIVRLAGFEPATYGLGMRQRGSDRVPT